jgi:hypothetical protein
MRIEDAITRYLYAVLPVMIVGNRVTLQKEKVEKGESLEEFSSIETDDLPKENLLFASAPLKRALWRLGKKKR